MQNKSNLLFIYIIFILFIIVNHSFAELILTANSDEDYTVNNGLLNLIDKYDTETSGFNDESLNKWFAFTFWELKQKNKIVTDAIIEIDIKALDLEYSYNDMIKLAFVNEFGDVYRAWEYNIGTNGPINGLLTYKWELGESETIAINLKSLQYDDGTEKDFVKYINEYGYLDIIVQDDTLVREVRLKLNYENLLLSLDIGKFEFIYPDIVEFPLYLDNPKNIGIISIDAILDFNSNIIEDSNETLILTDLLDNYSSVYNPNNNTLSIACSDNNYYTGSGLTGNLKFKITADVGEHTNVDFSTAKINNIVVDSTGNEFTVNPIKPSISFIDNIKTLEDSKQITTTFTISDFFTPAYDLKLEKKSSNQELLPDDNIIISGNSNFRQLEIYPVLNMSGQSTITITVINNYNLKNYTSFNLILTDINDPPDFDVIDISICEDSGITQVNNVISNINTGPISELNQPVINKWINNISYENNTLFKRLPTIINNSVSFETYLNSFGNCEIEICIQDNGGIENGGIDTKCKTINFDILPVNYPPLFSLKDINPVLEDSDLITIEQFISEISQGPENEADQETETIVTNTNINLFSKFEYDTEQGNLNLEPVKDEFGEIDIKVCIKDNGGIDNNGQDQTCKIKPITVLSVNDPPNFDLAKEKIIIAQGIHDYSETNLITNVSMGPANESDQIILQYIISEPSKPELFEINPYFNNDGHLIFKTAHNAYGSDFLNISIRDNGGCENQGNDISEEKSIEIVIKGFSVSGTIEYYSSGIPIPDTTVKLIGNNSYVTHTNENGQYIFENIPKGYYEIDFYKNSDLKGVKAYDAWKMSRFVVGYDEPDCYSFTAGNILNNGQYSGINTSYIAQYSVGLKKQFNDDLIHWVFLFNEQYCSTIKNRMYPYKFNFLLDANREDVVKGVRIGDTTGSWLPDSMEPEILPRNYSTIEVNIEEDDKVTIPLVIKDPINILGLDCEIKTNKNLIQYKKIELSNNTKDYHCDENSDLITKIAMYASLDSNYNGDEEVAFLTFDIIGNPGSTSLIEIVNLEVNEKRNINGGFLIEGEITNKVVVKILAKPKYKWILVSIPVILDNYDLNAIFPDALMAYRYLDGTYIEAKKLLPGLGYWVLVPEENNNVYFSGTPFTQYKLNLDVGFNLVGSVNDKVYPVCQPENACNKIYEYSNGTFIEVEVLKPRFGYFIEALLPGIINVNTQ